MEESKVTEFLPLRDVVFLKLRESILKGEIAPGTRLMEVHLAEQLGVSRTPVREAIRMLEQEGLAVVHPGRGAKVAKMTEKDLDDVLQIRSALDALAVRLACDERSDRDLERIKKAMVQFEEATKTGDLKQIAEADEAFHDQIYESSGNDKLIVIITNIREQMFRYRFEYIKDTSAYPRLIAEHREIFNGLVNRDKTSVEIAIQMHIAGQRKRVQDSIRRQ